MRTLTKNTFTINDVSGSKFYVCKIALAPVNPKHFNYGMIVNVDNYTDERGHGRYSIYAIDEFTVGNTFSYYDSKVKENLKEAITRLSLESMIESIYEFDKFSDAVLFMEQFSAT